MAVYIRMALYILAPLAALIPGVEYISTDGILTIDLEDVAASMAVALAGIGIVFARWGKK